MCLVVFALGGWNDAPFVLAANRDEYFARPAAPAAWWKHEGRDVFGGRDLEKGGTWMAISPEKRIAVVTNVRDLSKPQTGKSRGLLPLIALASEAHSLTIDVAEYPAFNLLAGDGDAMFYVSDDAGARRVAPGFHGLSNHRLDTLWPKVKRGLAVLARGPSKDALFEMLRDDRPAPDDELPKTGVPIDVERKLSSPFVSMPEVGYGTRCSTVVIRRANGSLEFEERTWNARGELAGVVSVIL
ncbi:MAG TPA: NRDE family protein [Polyangiaceae bacterium]|jgi:uncharacterized protein with NRDE domain|nr:NRDE family protein [Polyangiaceae bacterium]